MNVQFDWSTFRQARTYKDRGYFAKSYLADDLHEENLLLIDNLGNAKLPELEGGLSYHTYWRYSKWRECVTPRLPGGRRCC